MQLDVTCPKCKKSFQIPGADVGKRFHCRICDTDFRLDVFVKSVPIVNRKASTGTVPASTSVAHAAAKDASPKVAVDQSGMSPHTVPPVPQANGSINMESGLSPPTAPPTTAQPIPNGVAQALVTPSVAAPAPAASPQGLMSPTQPLKRRRRRPLLFWGIAGAAAVLVVALGIFLFPRLTRETQRSACIEIGSTSVNLLVVDFFWNGDELDFDIVDADDKKTDLPDLTTPDNKFKTDNIEKTLGAVSEFTAIAQQKHGVKAENIFVIVTSGLLETLTKKNERLVNDLTLSVNDRIGKMPVHVDAALEGQLSFDACIMRKDRKLAVLLDIGRSSLKGGYIDSNQFVPISISGLGSKAYSGKVEGEMKRNLGKSFEKLASELRQQEIDEILRTYLEDTHPRLYLRPKFCVIGGAAWSMATVTLPNKLGDLRVHFSPLDLQEFRRAVSVDNLATIREQTSKRVEDSKLSRKLDTELDRIEKRLDAHGIIAGAEILLGISEVLRFSEHKQLEYFREGHRAPLLGYLKKVGKFEERKVASKK